MVENPIINRIAFENVAFEDDIEFGGISSASGRLYADKVQNDVARILTLYRQSGYFMTMWIKNHSTSQNRVDLIYEIKEGKPTGVRRIRFVGNSDFSDADLREQIRTKDQLVSVLSSDDNYDPDRRFGSPIASAILS